MATATKKAGNTAKSNNKKALAKKTETVKSAVKNTAKTIVEPANRTLGDGFNETETVIETAKSVKPEKSVKAKKAASANGKSGCMNSASCR